MDSLSRRKQGFESPRERQIIPVDLTPLRILEIIRTAITAPDAVNFVSTAIAEHVTNHD